MRRLSQVLDTLRHDDLPFSLEAIWGSGADVAVIACLCILILITQHLGAHRVSGPSALLSQSDAEGSKQTSHSYVQNLLAVALCSIVAVEMSMRQAPDNVAYPNLYTSLRFVHSHASLVYACAVVSLLALERCSSFQRYVKGTRPLVLFLWFVWVALFPALRLLFHQTPYSGFWMADCIRADEDDSIRLANAHAALEKLPIMLASSTSVVDAEPWLCVAVPTTPRKRHYLTQSVGSLLGGLSSTELSQLRMKLVSSVPIHEADEIVAFSGSDGNRLSPVVEVIRGPDRSSESRDWVRTQNENYVAALNACKREGLPYVLVIEDDAIATKGVVSKIAEAIKAVDASSAKRWRVLKLFATEYWWGHWSNDSDTLLCLLVWPAVFGVCSMLVCVWLWRFKTSRCLASLAVFLCATSVASYVAWSFGRANLVRAFPEGASRHTPPDALCAMAQANVYPLQIVDSLAEHMRADLERPTDLAVCDFAVQGAGFGDQAQWLYSPSLFQHVGRFSSNEAKNQGSCVHTKYALTWSPA